MRPLLFAISSLAAVVSLAAPGTSTAQVTTFTDPSSFSGSETILTFEGAAEPLSEYGGVSFSQNGAGVGVVFDGDARPFGPQEITAIDNDVNPFTGLPIEITFPSAVTKVAFESRFNGYGQGLTVAFYAGNTPVGVAESQPPTDDSTSPNGWIFTGFDSLVAFDRIVVAGPNNGYVRIDNLRFEGSAPPPPPLVVACVPGPNPSENTPAANNQDGFFTVTASGGSGSLSISLGGYALANGETIKITQGGPGGVRLVNSMGGGIRHFQVKPGPAQVVVTDGTQTSTASCLLRP